jgi:hypothetical protein
MIAKADPKTRAAGRGFFARVSRFFSFTRKSAGEEEEAADIALFEVSKGDDFEPLDAVLKEIRTEREIHDHP